MKKTRPFDIEWVEVTDRILKVGEISSFGCDDGKYMVQVWNTVYNMEEQDYAILFNACRKYYDWGTYE